MTPQQQALTLTVPSPPPSCSFPPCDQSIERSGACRYHRSLIDSDRLARFDAVWDNQGREDWLRLIGALYATWWADHRSTA